MNDKATILLVDDDPAILLTVGDRLMAEGYNVVKADSGEDALDHLNRHAITLVVLDIGMPGMSGLAFLKTASKDNRHKDIPILVFTARSNMEGFFTGMGTAGFVPKTAEPELLIKTIRGIVAGRQTRLNREATQDSRPPVLIVENDEQVQYHLTRLLKMNGMDPRTVRNPEDLAAAVSAHAPRAILLKYILPNISGPTIAQFLHDTPATRSIPVILYDDSGLHRPGDVSVANITRFLSRPSDEDVLRSISHAMALN